ncbi:MAG: hypothetical protein KJS95_10440 [Gammaproteobacteria bacterium]|nr:hypothetical protein [Gammaproteobacteria bacterium]
MTISKSLAGAAAALWLAAGTVAVAADYVVARSNVASIAKGAQFAAGANLPLEDGQVVTMVSSGGEVVVLRGAAGGVRLPALAGGAQSASVAALTALVNRPPPRRSFGAMRGKETCPAVETLTTMDSILAASAVEGCGLIARDALERYIVAREAAATAAPAPSPAPR